VILDKQNNDKVMKKVVALIEFMFVSIARAYVLWWLWKNLSAYPGWS